MTFFALVPFLRRRARCVVPAILALVAVAGFSVFRTYNHRAQFNDSNHRYTTDPATYQLMQSLGWAPEGIVFCAAL